MTEHELLEGHAETRRWLETHGGDTAARCYQCGTCSSACELATSGALFPRRQMLHAQWGLEERLMSDPAIWLCHQCNDCTTRCPRDARPGDVLQAARSMMIERSGSPAWMARLVSRAGQTWPLLIGVPILFWLVLVTATFGLKVPAGFGPEVGYDAFVPHVLIYSVFFPIVALMMLAVWTSGRRYWASIDHAEERKGSFLLHLGPTLLEILSHKRFATCETAHSRRIGHMALVLGFLGAAATSGLLVIALYGFGAELPLPQYHPFKILGNLSAVLLVFGGGQLFFTRLKDKSRAGKSTAFDRFFLWIVMLVILSGVAVELWRLSLDPAVACGLYIVHLGAVLCLFLTLPYSKFAHIIYRTLAMVHERMVQAPEAVQTLSHT